MLEQLKAMLAARTSLLRRTKSVLVDVVLLEAEWALITRPISPALNAAATTLTWENERRVVSSELQCRSSVIDALSVSRMK